MTKFLFLLIFCCDLRRLYSFIVNKPIVPFRNTRNTCLVVHQAYFDTNIIVLTSIIVSSYILNINDNKLSADIHAVNHSLSNDIYSVKRDLQYLQIDNGFTVELTIRNNLAATMGLKYSEKYELAGIPSLIAWFPVKPFSTEKLIDPEYLVTSRQRTLSAYCAVSIECLLKEY